MVLALGLIPLPALTVTFQRLFNPRSWSQCILNNLYMIYASKVYINHRHWPSICAWYSGLPTRGFAAWSLISVSCLGLVETIKWLLSFEYVRSEIITFFHPHYSGPPIVEALASGYAEIVLILLGASADPNQYSLHSALHSASEKGDARIVRMLIDAGADVKQEGATALCEAANGGHVQITQMLLDAGAKLDQ
jgi:hypothetical protein